MKNMTATFCAILILFFCLNTQVHSKVFLSNKTRSSSDTDSNTTTGSSSPPSLNGTASNNSTIISNGSSSDSNNSSDLQKPDSSSQKNTISELCNSLADVQKALADLELEVQLLTTQFKNHITLYKKWILNAKNDEDRNKIKQKEADYLNGYLKTALGINDLLPGLNAKLSQYNSANCKTAPVAEDSSNSSNNSGADSDGADKSSGELIQIIVKRYDELGIKMDPSLAKLIQIKNKNFLKK